MRMGRRAGTGSSISTPEEAPVIVLSVPVPLTGPSSLPQSKACFKHPLVLLTCRDTLLYSERHPNITIVHQLLASHCNWGQIYLSLV